MSLREEMARYEHLTGESAEHIPIIKIGAFLDGVDRGIAELEKLKEELYETAEMHSNGNYYLRDEWIDEYIDNHIAELKGENNAEKSEM